ncbi:TadE-like protein [Idiomarina sp. A28L]|uniref:TadE/TadG family type IV pilus assembly protein n=1 Tax=Idiomarina sp. A28L TaxID=1036674 RepID=UPI0002138E7E|nr:TadE/TadG family type IV pilus assembly protein [Idiomarina sp. A28L]EGN76325.1 TadE-like protein [Idiomarina sp. A28L]
MKKRTYKNFAIGQSTVEAAISLLFFCIFIAITMQLLWLLLAQQMLQATTLSASRFAAKSNVDLVGMNLLIQNRVRAIPGIELHIPKIKRLRPTDEDIKELGIYYSDSKGYRLPAEFSEVSLSLLNRAEQEKYLQVRVLQMEIIYCFSLRVPLAATLIKQVTKYSENDIYCQLQQRAKPMLPIRTRATIPLENDLWIENRS